MQPNNAKRKAGYAKIADAAKQALANDCEYYGSTLVASIRLVALNYLRPSIRCISDIETQKYATRICPTTAWSNGSFQRRPGGNQYSSKNVTGCEATKDTSGRFCLLPNENFRREHTSALWGKRQGVRQTSRGDYEGFRRSHPFCLGE